MKYYWLPFSAYISTSRDVALSLEAHIDGAEITEYREGEVAIAVIFQSVDEERQVFGDFWNLNVSSATRGCSVAWGCVRPRSNQAQRAGRNLAQGIALGVRKHGE